MWILAQNLHQGYPAIMMSIQRITLYLLVLPFLLLVLGISSCSGPESNSASDGKTNQQTKDADIRKTFDNSGNLISQVEYKDDKRDGTAYNYYKNGKPKLKVEYKEGKKHGSYSWFYENGNVYKEVEFKEGLKDGIERFYREDGSLKYETPYKEDRPGTGFVEYGVSGEPKAYLSSLEITINVRKGSGGVYSTFFGLTDYSNVKEVYYYLGELKDGQYLYEGLEELYTTNKTAEAHLDKAKVNTVNVSAEVITKDGRTIVLQKSRAL